jgi:acyl-CoA thioesterase
VRAQYAPDALVIPTGYRQRVPSAFGSAIAVEQTRPGVYTVTVDPGWSIGERPNGGYLMALVAHAAVTASPHPDPLSISAHFLRPPSFGPGVIEVDDLRVGRTVGFHNARLIENGETVVDARVTSGRLPDDDPAWIGDKAPDLPPPEECPRGRPETPDGTYIALFDQLEVRYDRETMQWASDDNTHEPVLRAWVRIKDDDTDSYAVAVAADALPPAVFALGFRGWAPTVEMTTYLRGRPAPGWMRVAVHTQAVAGGWFDEQAVVWDADGRLVAQARQLAMIGRPRKG